MSFRKLVFKLRGLPRRIDRITKKISRYVIATFANKALIKVIMRVPGTQIDPSFDSDHVKQYAEIGQCIYCGASGPSVDLRREHILPYFLGGDAILPAATCSKCADITSKIETYCAEHIFDSVRVHHKIHSRTRTQNHLPMFKISTPPPYLSGRIPVPINDHPGVLVLPSFDPPELVMKYEHSPLEDPGLKWHFYSLTNDHNERIKRLHKAGIKNVKLASEFDIDIFLRLLAKIAHGIAVAKYGINGFRPLLIDLILKGNSSPLYFIGSATDRTPPSVPNKKDWARPEIRLIGNKKYIVVFFRFFPYLGTPVYTVVVGERISSGFIDSLKL